MAKTDQLALIGQKVCENNSRIGLKENYMFITSSRIVALSLAIVSLNLLSPSLSKASEQADLADKIFELSVSVSGNNQIETLNDITIEGREKGTFLKVIGCTVQQANFAAAPDNSYYDLIVLSGDLREAELVSNKHNARIGIDTVRIRFPEATGKIARYKVISSNPGEYLTANPTREQGLVFRINHTASHGLAFNRLTDELIAAIRDLDRSDSRQLFEALNYYQQSYCPS